MDLPVIKFSFSNINRAFEIQCDVGPQMWSVTIVTTVTTVTTDEWKAKYDAHSFAWQLAYFIF